MPFRGSWHSFSFQNNQVFEDDAILFASKKTAALCGDIRKAFQICRAAAELVMEDAKKGGNRSRLKNGRPVVRISDVQRGSRSSFNTALLTAVSMSTPYQALVLVTIASLSRSTGRESGGFDIQEILVKMESLCGSFGRALYMPPPSFGETMTLLNQLGEVRTRCIYRVDKSSFCTLDL
jgi:Cdc6-like AAA superfamily ATPase